MISKQFFNVTAIGAGSFGLFIAVKTYLGPPSYKGHERITGKTYIITGASSGIGEELAYSLALKGARLILACRNQVKCEETRQQIGLRTHNKQVECRQLDLSSQSSIREFSEEFLRTESQLHGLIACAGEMRFPKKQVTVEGIERQLGVNFLGRFLLVNLLLEKLQASAPSRVVLFVCEDYKKGKIDFEDLNCDRRYSPDDSYTQSQLANVLFGQELARRLSKSNVNVLLCDPGPTNTRLRRHLAYNNNFFSESLFLLINFITLRPVWQGTVGPLACSVSEDLGKMEASGKLYRDLKEVHLADVAIDVKTAGRLWAVAEKWTRWKNS